MSLPRGTGYGLVVILRATVLRCFQVWTARLVPFWTSSCRNCCPDRGAVSKVPTRQITAVVKARHRRLSRLTDGNDCVLNAPPFTAGIVEYQKYGSKEVFAVIKPSVLAVIFALTASSTSSDPARWKTEWPQTNFSVTTVDDWSEIISGGPPKDGIPALSNPTVIPVSEESRLGDREPVITLEAEGALARAYPLRYLTWHEIVNDQVGDLHVAVTFCPLCNSGIVFDRRTNLGVLEFGVSGKLRHSDMIMFDRQTESWWQQAVGSAIAGEMTGAELRALPTWVESWDSFRARHPDGLVMDEPAFRRQYGTNPYRRYDSSVRPFLFDGDLPPHGVPALARVVRVGDRAWPLDRVRRAGRITETALTIEWLQGMASALDTSRIADGRDVGGIRVRDANGRDVVHDVMFAFAFHAFWPDGQWMLED